MVDPLHLTGPLRPKSAIAGYSLALMSVWLSKGSGREIWLLQQKSGKTGVAGPTSIDLGVSKSQAQEISGRVPPAEGSNPHYRTWVTETLMSTLIGHDGYLCQYLGFRGEVKSHRIFFSPSARFEISKVHLNADKCPCGPLGKPGSLNKPGWQCSRIRCWSLPAGLSLYPARI